METDGTNEAMGDEEVATDFTDERSRDSTDEGTNEPIGSAEGEEKELSPRGHEERREGTNEAIRSNENAEKNVSTLRPGAGGSEKGSGPFFRGPDPFSDISNSAAAADAAGGAGIFPVRGNVRAGIGNEGVEGCFGVLGQQAGDAVAGEEEAEPHPDGVEEAADDGVFDRGFGVEEGGVEFQEAGIGDTAFAGEKGAIGAEAMAEPVGGATGFAAGGARSGGFAGVGAIGRGAAGGGRVGFSGGRLFRHGRRRRK